MLARLQDWAARKLVSFAVKQRQRSAMKREWWSALAGSAGSGFHSAAVGRLTSSMAQWSGSVNADLDGNLSILRARARALCANNEWGRRFLSLVATNLVGPDGPTLQVRATLTSGKLDKAANDAIEVHWQRWASHADVRGQMDLAHLMRVAAKAVARDGEALIRKVKDRRLPYGFALQLLEADRLDVGLNARLENGNVIRMGVELDSVLRPIAYHIMVAHPGERYQGVAPRHERVPAEDIYHLYVPERAEQVRGFTWFHAVLLRADMLHGYEEAAVIAARVGAAKVGVWVNTNGDPKALDILADGKSAAGVPQMSADPGEFLAAPHGWDLKNWDPQYPAEAFESFMKACLRGVAAGLDVAAHNLTGDMTDVNYSSARIAELSERDTWTVLQKWWAQQLMLPLYRDWLASALLMGEITLLGLGTPLPAERYPKFSEAARFQGRRWAWVDPLKEAEAARALIGAGLTSRTEIAASQGREIEDVIDELAQENKLLQAAGVSTDLGVGGTAGDDKDDKDDKDAKRAAPSVTVNAPISITVPEREVNLEATVEAPVVNLTAPR